MADVRTAQRKTRPGSGIASRYRALLLTHGSLEEKLADELKRPMPDSGTIQRLKRRKLAIKDELASIDRLLDAIGTTQNMTSPGLDPAGRPIIAREPDSARREQPSLAQAVHASARSRPLVNATR